MMRRLLAFAAIAVIGTSAVIRSSNTAFKTPNREFRKKNAGPPSEFAMYNLPNPREGGVMSQSALFPILLGPVSSADSSAFTWEGSAPIDSTTLAQISFVTRLSGLKVEFQLPGMGSFANADALITKFADKSGKVIEDSFGLGGDKVPTTTYYFTNPTPGIWNVRVTAQADDVAQMNKVRAATPGVRNGGQDQPHLFMMVFNESPLAADAYLHSYEQLKQGQTVTIRANLADKTYDRLSPEAIVRTGHPSAALVKTVDLQLYLPDGTEEQIAMHDDGAHNDLLANDGVYGTTFAAGELGNYIAEVVLSGITSDGHAFLRNSLHSLKIVRADLTVASAQVVEHDAERLLIQLVTSVTSEALAAEDDVTHRAYVEVWGTNSQGAKVPVCWLSGMTDLAAAANTNGKLAFDLELNAKWLTLAGASEPLELRNVYVQERDAWVPVSTVASLPVASEGVVARMLTRPHLSAAAVTGITDEMRKGVNPYKNGSLAAAAAGVKAGEGAIMLVHGYCAPANNFPPTQFTNSVVFQDFNQNRPTDLFARLIKEQGDVQPSFAIIAHSHGGLASTHLNAAYWSNLNINDDGKAPLVQSVGSPYQGVPVSGLLAAVGKILGLGCGSIEDLTYDGARLWLAAVPAEQRVDTYYYTTQYETGHLINYCNLASNSVLAWPNDGITEVANNQFPGANNMGHKQAWCHSEGMKYPGQGKDPERNAYMNAHAKR